LAASIRSAFALTAIAVTVAFGVGCGDSAPDATTATTPQPARESRLQRESGEGAGALAGRRDDTGSAADQAAIGALIRHRSAALGAGRPTAYAATATPARQGRAAADVRRARRLGVRGVRITGLGVRVREKRAVAFVRSTYRLDGVPGRWTYAQVLRLRRAGGGWRVTAQRSRAPRPPWELASHQRSDTRHFTIFAPEGVDPEEAALGATLERAHATIRERLPGSGGARRYPVFIAADFGDMEAMTRGIRDVGRLSAITDLTVRTAGPAERVTAVLGVRILIPWPSFVSLAPETRERVLTHELAHAVLAPATSGRAPAWLQEGIALYLSGDRRTALAWQALAPAGGALAAPATQLAFLAHPDAMAALAGRELSAAYALSSSTAYYIAGTFGQRKLLDLLDIFADETLRGRPGRSLTDRAARRVLGIGLRRLERDVHAWLRVGAPASG
jgi:hypothetical protein